jgi:hypothetical protein
VTGATIAWSYDQCWSDYSGNQKVLDFRSASAGSSPGAQRRVETVTVNLGPCSTTRVGPTRRDSVGL